MPASGNYGYQGFASWAQKHQPTLKPGETLDTRAHKFYNVGHGVVYRDTIPTSAPRDKTVLQESYSNVRQGDYKVPDRRGISVQFLDDAKKLMDATKPCVSVTQSQASFVPFERGLEIFSDAPDEVFEHAFYDTAGEFTYIKPSQVAGVIESVVPGVSPQIHGNMKKYFEMLQPEDEISLTMLLESVYAVRRALMPPTLGGTRVKASAPEWLAMSKRRQPEVSGVMIRSSYQKDMGKAGEWPQQRQYLNRTGMNSTTEDLSEGTTKDTYHIPGYGGHIPASKRNPDVVKHGEAKDERLKPTSLRLYHRHDLPGYTGHCPSNARNDLGERTSGAHAATTSGAAALGLVL